MYATSTHVHQGHNHYDPSVIPNAVYALPNGHQPQQQQQPSQHHHPQPHHQQQHQPQQPQHQQRPSQANAAPKQPVHVVGVPSVHIENDRLVVGSSQSSSTRSYTPLKVLGDGSFGTVWLCDWHGTLPPNTPLSPMQAGGARPEWNGKRLVAVKRMKKKWEGGWDECQRLKELQSLRAIPFHPNIIPLYDFFLMPATKELYFVFESMEGNLYHLIKARKGRALAGGLVSSIFRQICSGLYHIHAAGYFHRDMKPENVLVTTTGLFDYNTLSPVAPPNAPPEKDVVAIIKLADFGLARETNSKPPYTEYVSTRWYRAPEVLLMSRDYSNPVDMWALGTIMAELVNLRPLFPGADQVDQVARICEILGDPSDSYGPDSGGNLLGGGAWPRGIKMAKAVGFMFPKIQPRDIRQLFDKSVPPSLVDCIRDLLRYDPDRRLTSFQCLTHPYLLETTSRNNIPFPHGLQSPMLQQQHTVLLFTPPQLHYHHPARLREYTHDGRMYQQRSNSSDIIREETRARPAVASSVWSGDRIQPPGISDYNMDVTPQAEYAQPMEIQSSPIAPEFPARGPVEQEPPIQDVPANKPGKFGSLGFGSKRSKWGLGMFGGDKHHQNGLPPVDEGVASMSTPSLKRTQSSSSDSRSLREPSPVREASLHPAEVKKINKKEAERLQKEADRQRRLLAEKMQREQARAVMQKRNQALQQKPGADIDWQPGAYGNIADKSRQGAGPVRKKTPGESKAPSTVNAAAGRFEKVQIPDWRRETERHFKARRREFDIDDQHSMSSSDVHSIGCVSAISFASVGSDPGPSQLRNRPSLFEIRQMTQSTASSVRTSDDFPQSARSSHSLSLDGQLSNDFRNQASMATLPGTVSPPPMQMLSLSPSLSPSPSPAPWVQPPQDGLSIRRDHAPSFISLPADPTRLHPNGQYSPYEYHAHGNELPKSAINPIFKVSPMPDQRMSSSPQPLPPFSHLEAVAGGDAPPSPMSLSSPRDNS
ncbi:kinase-like domain-containing protein [Schizophyllum amplum]|uniref:Kinase-like domain-containing protein n=1 Tax=Schizophyllum amplum TaxID=97359 RepID=A0A550CNC6_9AGAR|nr:kinase-like domain-containing protein [Auriculariopsis ampla]